ncbi:hypothetical protein ACA910_000663 [Epithemia clementina (nom. ined.)]
MVLSFSEDPFDTRSPSLNAPSDSGPDHQFAGDNSSACSNSLVYNASVALSDESSIEAVPCNPNYFNVGEDDPPTVPAPPNSNPNRPIPTIGNQSCRPSPSIPHLKKHLDVFKLPLALLPKAMASFLALDPVDWHDTFCSDFHFTLNLNPATWSSSSFAKVCTPSNFQNSLTAT